MMIKYWKIMFMLPFVLLAGCSTKTIKKQQNGVILKLVREKETDARMLRIQVCTEDIIRVTASPGKSFSTRPSLMVNKTDWPPVSWTVKEDSGQIFLSTAKLSVRVNRANGSVVFFGPGNRLILREKPYNGKIISPAEVMGEKTRHVRQIFDSPQDEAFYGLGQHQNNIMNYKGHDVDLWQYNVVAAVPFLVSSRNYGILWDNNSRTKFGDIRDFQSLSMLTLYDKEGTEGGLTAEYFEKPDFTSLYASRTEQRIEHEFLDVNDAYPDGFTENVASVRWSGEISSDVSGVHKFRLYCSGYTKMWLNGELIMDSWRQNWMPWTYLPTLNMEAGKHYTIKIEWVHQGGYIGLKCLTPEEDMYKNSMSLYSEVGDQIDYYFIKGGNADQIIQGYREITGSAPMMPKWAMGLWQCRQRYRSQEELLNVVREFRIRRIPLDNIVQDWFYWPEDKWGDHDFDKARFPDPDGMVKELHNKLHTRIMLSVWPKFYVGTDFYNQFEKKGWLYKRNVEKKERDWVGKGYVSTFYDPCSQGARDLFWKQMESKLFVKGFDAWWLDATEPDIHSNLSRPEMRLRTGPTALGTAARYLNTYSLMNAKGVYEGQRGSDPDKRVFILTRSAFAGQQRYAAATWSGDIAARWYDLKAQVPAGLNFCLSGIPYWTSDIGGFAVETRYHNAAGENLEEWRELMTRWFQFGAFCPLFRVHGEFPYREIYNVAPEDHPAYQTMLSFDKLRYRLMPYIYSLTGMVTRNDYTMMRALVMDFGADKNVLNIGDQYMFGPALLVNPVSEYKARFRQVYLPAGSGWYDFFSGRYIDGGQTILADAPYSDIPLFVREGAIIPFGPELQYSDEKPADPVLLYVYSGRNGFFELYEDENVNYNYEKGRFSVIPLTYDETTRTLTIGDRQGEFDGMLTERTFFIVRVGRDRERGVDFDIKPDRTALYRGSELSVKLD